MVDCSGLTIGIPSAFSLMNLPSAHWARINSWISVRRRNLEGGQVLKKKRRRVFGITWGLFPPQRQRFRLRWIRRDLAAGERRSAIHIRVIAELPDGHVVKSFIHRDDVQNLRRVPRVTND